MTLSGSLPPPRVEDWIARCSSYVAAEPAPASLEQCTRLVIHRTRKGANAEEIASVFAQHPELGPASGYQMPYTFVVGRGGDIQQALCVTDQEPHAKAWGVVGIGIGVVGDFRSGPPSNQQWHSLLVLCHVFSGWLGGAQAIRGHDELPGSTRDPSQRCPGPMLDMDRLRAQVTAADQARVACLGIRI